jgi:ribose-phosphate pyrophosphokinase
MIVFYSSIYQNLAQKIIKKLSFDEGRILRSVFPDGEQYYRIEEDLRSKEVVLISGAYDDVSTLETFDLACGIVGQGALRLHMVIPYFGYSTMERAVKKGEIVTAKNRALLFSSIPSANHGNCLYLVDLHTGGLEHYFERGTQVLHIYAKDLIFREARRLGGNDFVLGSTDAGRAKWVESLANDLQVPAAFVYKRRISGDKTEIIALNGQVENKHVIIYDDMIRTGGSLIQAAQAYKSAGASKISAIATHGVFPKNALQRIVEHPIFDHVSTTNSHPHAKIIDKQKQSVLCLSSIFIPFLQSSTSR